jgi:hypothetical protein
VIVFAVTWEEDGVLRQEGFGPFERLDSPEVFAFMKAWRAKHGDPLHAVAYMLTPPDAV